MTTEIKLPFGYAVQHGRMVSIDEVARGLACECVCAECGVALVAAKGDIVTHHFRHLADMSACVGARETALHKYAKQIICETLDLRLPDHLGEMKSAVSEVELKGIRPDVLAHYETEPVAIEIWVAHQVPLDKIKEYEARGLAAVEIDLRYHHTANKNEAEWREAIITTATRQWLYPPLFVRERRKRAQEERQQQYFAAQQAALEAYNKASRERVEAEERLRAMQERRHQIAEHQAQVDQLARARQNEEVARAVERSNAARLEREIKAHNAEFERTWNERRRAERRGPDLQALVAAHGGYHRITPEAWVQWDLDMAEWHDKVRSGYFRYNNYPPL